jgi:hypothetical protein
MDAETRILIYPPLQKKNKLLQLFLYFLSLAFALSESYAISFSFPFFHLSDWWADTRGYFRGIELFFSSAKRLGVEI